MLETLPPKSIVDAQVGSVKFVGTWMSNKLHAANSQDMDTTLAPSSEILVEYVCLGYLV